MRRSRSTAARFCLAWLSAAAALMAAPAAHAAWYRAETDRFVIYAQGFESWARDYAVRLSTFDAVLRAFHPSVSKDRASQKLEIILVQGTSGLRQVSPGASPSMRGFYAAGGDGVFAVVDASESVVGKDDVLFHEYAHHFMSDNFPAAYPGWFVEGWAEYFMTTEIGPREIKVGNYNPNRAYWLFNSSWLPLGDLLGKRASEVPKDKQGIYYPQAWLLMHYMRSDETRGKQLDQATRAIADGEDPVKAFEAATGLTMAQLTANLRRYRKLPTWGLPGNFVKPATVTVTTMPKSADDFLLPKVRLALSRVGVRDEPYLAALRRGAARYPGDQLAELTLAHAEFMIGDPTAGEEIVQRRLSADPNEVEALRIAGLGQLLAGQREPNNRRDRFAAARRHFGKAYKLDQKDYRILFQYAYARTSEPSFPSANDIDVLGQAYLMAPAVPDIAMVRGMALIETGEKEAGKRLLARIANNPHGGPMAVKARALMEGKTISEADAAAGAASEEDERPAEPAQPAKPAAN